MEREGADSEASEASEATDRSFHHENHQDRRPEERENAISVDGPATPLAKEKERKETLPVETAHFRVAGNAVRDKAPA